MRAIQSSQQLELAKVVGIRTNAESRVIAGNAGQLVVVWDAQNNTRWPVFIRIRNLHATEPLYVSEDTRDEANKPQCTAGIFSDILAADSLGTDKGGGAGVEWDMNRPSCVSIFGTNAWRAVVTVRYADEN